MRRLGQLLRAAGYGLLGVTAATGVALAAAGLLASSGTGSRQVGAWLGGLLDGVVAGHLKLGGLGVKPGGDLELRDVEVDDPSGRPVIRVALVRARLDLGLLARRIVGVELELERPELVLEPGEGGRLTIAEAFASPASPAAATAPGDPWRGWNVRVTRLALRDATVTWRGEGERTWLRADRLSLDGAGSVGSNGVQAALDLSGGLEAPLQGPLAIDLSARIAGSRLTVPRLLLGAASSRLEAFGELDWQRMSFRVAASRVALAERDLTHVAGARVTGGDLEGRLYAESDGARLTAAVELSPPRGGSGGGRAALAFRPGARSPRTLGFDVAVSELDPSRVLSRAPRGRVTVLGGGAVVWPVPGPGAFSRGHLDLKRLDVRLPGLELGGAGRWRDAGGMAGTLRLVVAELGEAGPALAALAGVTLPALAGRAEADLVLAGTAAAPEATLAVRTAGLEVAGVSLGDGRADARLAGGVLELEASSGLALLEGATLGVRGSGRLSPGWDEVRLSRLELDLPGQAWTLAAPATVRFEGPRVDRADLRSGSQRLVVSGGPPAAGGRSELQVEASGIELARLPHALVPQALGLAGTAGGALRLAGPARRRTLEARVEVAGGEVRSLTGLAVTGELAWSAETGRVQVKGSLRGGETGSLDLAADLPWPLDRAAPAAPVSGRVALGRGRLAPLLRALDVQVPAGGLLDGELVLDGSAAAPRLAGRVALAEGRWADLAPLQLTVAVETPGTALHVEAALALGADRLVKAVADVPLQRGSLLAHPGRTMSRLRLDPWSAGVEVPGFELAWLAGKAGVPAGLLGRVSGQASFDGSLSAPRGTVTLSLSALTLTGTPPLDGQVTASLQPGRTALSIQLDDAGAPALRLAASVAAPVERLIEVEVQRQAPLVVSAQVPGLTLPGIVGERWSVSGRVAMTLETTGTLAAPRATLGLDATGLQLGGQPVGDLKGTARIGDATAALDLALRPVEGGTLGVQGSLGPVPGLGTAAMAGAPLQLTVTGRDLGVGFLPALLPGRVRAASGTVQADLGVSGSPGAPRLAGQVALAGGTLTLPSLGTFTDIGFEAAFDRDAVRVQRLVVKRGAGRVEGGLSLSGLGGAEARLGGSVQATNFSLARAGMDVATIDANATIGGRYRDGRIEVEVDVASGGTVRLPRKAPRALQPIEDRPDIIIGEAPPEPAGGAEGPGAPRREPGVTMTFRVRGDELHLKSDQPRVNIELRTDSTWEVTASPLLVSGTLEAYLGSFEPLSGRLFKVVRGKVAFTGGALGDAQLDLAADYDNPSAKVHAAVTGTVQSPNLRLTSEPALDEAKLAMLIVTGRADVNLGASQGSGLSAKDSSALTAQDAGMAAAMAVANKVFENQLGAKMPLDSLTLDSSAVTAAKQLTDRILISYIRRFDARPEKGENVDEVRVQYHMTARWTLESRYGNSGAGGASIMWQRDY